VRRLSSIVRLRLMRRRRDTGARRVDEAMNSNDAFPSCGELKL